MDVRGVMLQPLCVAGSVRCVMSRVRGAVLPGPEIGLGTEAETCRGRARIAVRARRPGPCGGRLGTGGGGRWLLCVLQSWLRR